MRRCSALLVLSALATLLVLTLLILTPLLADAAGASTETVANQPYSLNAKIAARRALKKGDVAPDFALPNSQGEEVALHALLNKGSVVIAFYRGTWCPYCNRELRALQNYLEDIQKKGATLVAISPQKPDFTLSTVEKRNLTFEVLSDVGNKIARKFKLTYRMPVVERGFFHATGHRSLEKYNGDDSYELPLPATYVVDQSGVIVYAFVNHDFRKRMPAKELLRILDNSDFSHKHRAKN